MREGDAAAGVCSWMPGCAWLGAARGWFLVWDVVVPLAEKGGEEAEMSKIEDGMQRGPAGFRVGDGGVSPAEEEGRGEEGRVAGDRGVERGDAEGVRSGQGRGRRARNVHECLD